MPNLIVSECFGPTVQGEGPAAGRPAYFVRLGLCNLDCAWCDTPYTWDFTGKLGVVYERDKLERVDPEALANRVLRESRRRDIVVISGGEPLVQQRALRTLVGYIAEQRHVHIETNGTLVPGGDLLDRVEQWVVSPKLSTARVSKPAEIPEALQVLADAEAAFKFVITGPWDEHEVVRLVERYGIKSRNVYVMPEGITADQIVRLSPMVADIAVRHGYNMSTRLHVLAWGNERGR